MRMALFTLLFSTTTVFAEDTPLNFDTEKLYQWQLTNNSMDVAECTKLEDEAKAKTPDLEAKADPKRKEECATEAKNFALDSGFASYTLYAGCLKEGPGSL
jgi:hypothetical protein